MEIKIRKLVRLLGSKWAFTFTLLLFAAESSWLALTSRFPGAFDETYHFSLIQFFGHRLNPIVTSQTSYMYRFGPMVHNPPFLYHYLMSFPYRVITLFTTNLEVQVISLRFVNVALAITSLLIIRKILRLIHISDALANVVILAFALTPLVSVVSAQINYDNLLILLVSACMYETVSFIQGLNKGRLDTKKLLVILCLCLFSSLVKFAFLPVFAAIVILLAWKIAVRWRLDAAGLKTGARKSFASIPKYTKLVLLTATLLGSLLFAWFYVVNLVEYHNPAPQCDQILSVQDCKHYYAWDNSYKIQSYYAAHPAAHSIGVLQYSGYWFMSNTFQVFGAQVPLQGHLYSPPLYLMVVALLGTAMFICVIVNFKKMLRENQDLLVLITVSLIYCLSLFVRNYNDYLRVGQPMFIHGRYLLPVLVYVYIVLASGLRSALVGQSISTLTVKACLALTVIFSFIYYGGFRQYVSYVDPVYGRISPSNHFILDDASKGN